MAPTRTERLLVPLDGSASARRALVPARHLARRLGVGLWVVTVDDPADPATTPDEVLAAAVAELDGHEVETSVLAPGDPAVRIAALDEAHPEALCCLSTRGRHPLMRTLLGSVAHEVVRRSTRAVLLVGPGYDPVEARPPERVVAALDGTPDGEAVLPWAIALADDLDAPLDLIHVIYPRVDPAVAPPPSQREQDELRYCRQTAARTAGTNQLVTPLTIEHTDPVVALSDHADEFRGSVLAVASRPGGPVGEALLGSVAARLLRQSPAPVLVADRPDPRRW